MLFVYIELHASEIFSKARSVFDTGCTWNTKNVRMIAVRNVSLISLTHNAC